MESSDCERFHIFTLEFVIGSSLPWALPLDEHWRVVDFEWGCSATPGKAGVQA